MCVRPTLTLFPACSHPAYYDTDGLTHWIADAMVLGRRHDRDELEGMGLTIPPEWALDSDGQLLRDGNGLPVTKSGPFAGRVAVPGAKKNPPPEPFESCCRSRKSRRAANSAACAGVHSLRSAAVGSAAV